MKRGSGTIIRARLLTALIKAGLALTSVTESDRCHFQAVQTMVADGTGFWTVPPENPPCHSAIQEGRSSRAERDLGRRHDRGERVLSVVL